MIKIMSIVLTGAIALLAGAYYIAPTQQTSLIANADSLGFLNYYIADDHVEITDCLDMAMGRVIGKQGRIAKAIRTIMRSGATRMGMDSIAVEIG